MVVGNEKAFGICLCNDLTKTHERFYRGTPSEVLSELNENPNAEKGEFTLIVEMPVFEKTEDEKIPSSPYGALIDEMIAGAPSLRDAIDAVLNRDNTPFKKNELKEAAIKIKEIFSE